MRRLRSASSQIRNSRVARAKPLKLAIGCGHCAGMGRVNLEHPAHPENLQQKGHLQVQPFFSRETVRLKAFQALLLPFADRDLPRLCVAASAQGPLKIQGRYVSKSPNGLDSDAFLSCKI